MKFKKIAIITLIISGGLSLAADIIYGSKAQAEEYLFGNFMGNLSSFGFTIFSLITLFTLLFLVIKKLNPMIMEKIKFEEDEKPLK